MLQEKKMENGSFPPDYVTYESTSYCDKFNTTKSF